MHMLWALIPGAAAAPLLVAVSACAGDSPSEVVDASAAVDSVIVIDEAHHNFHTATGRYAPFAAVLREAGYTVKPGTGVLTAELLSAAGVLVIANALHARNAGDDWSLPTPSAFSAAEIEAVRTWVEAGGALLLIADHMPFPGAAGELAAAFGVRFENGFAFDTLQLDEPVTCLRPHQVHVFRRGDGTLLDHPVTRGTSAGERVDSVATFTGQAFRFDPAAGAQPLMLFGASAVTLLPDTAWAFGPHTPRASAQGAAQGAVLELGRGRVAVFGEAAMFTVQTCGAGLPMGMNAPAATGNAPLLLNTIRWLTE